MTIPTSGRRIAIFYYVIARDNGIGRVNRLLLEQLCSKYDFTVFATKFDNPCPDRIKWVRIHCPLRPLLLSGILYRICASIAYAWQRLVKRRVFDIIQSSDAVFVWGDIADAHFCSKYYQRRFFALADLKSLRGIAGALVRQLNSFFERLAYRRAPLVVVPSNGLRRELVENYKVNLDRIHTLPHPVDMTIWPPTADEKAQIRSELNLSTSEIILVFAALGDFERKGLGILIDSLADPRLSSVKLLVVGGTDGSLAPYVERAKECGAHRRVAFCGKHPTIRRFLWAADAFVLPSRYEVFPAVVMQAACSGLPLITTSLNGVEEYAIEGSTGFEIRELTSAGIADAVACFLALPQELRRKMGSNARNAVSDYTVDRFMGSWDQMYSLIAPPHGVSPRVDAPLAPKIP